MANTRPEITRRDLKRLHDGAGGECSFAECEVRDNLVEAHIIGEKPTAARGRLPLPDGVSMDSYENRIILCPNHHALIDDKEARDAYSPAALVEMKCAHERKMAFNRKSPSIVAGQIKASGTDGDRVVGVKTKGPTRFEPGTQVSADGTRIREVVGIEIGEEIDP